MRVGLSTKKFQLAPQFDDDEVIILDFPLPILSLIGLIRLPQRFGRNSTGNSRVFLQLFLQRGKFSHQVLVLLLDIGGRKKGVLGRPTKPLIFELMVETGGRCLLSDLSGEGGTLGSSRSGLFLLLWEG